MKSTVKIAKLKYPADQYDVLWLFDQSPCHTKQADDALVVCSMGVKDGGKQPIMHDTQFQDTAEPDFCGEKSVVENYMRCQGHQALFFPKFHCELNATEPCWCHSKKRTRAYCQYSIVGLRKHVHPALETVSVDLARKFVRKVRDYIKAYVEGYTPGTKLVEQLKVYKSHRRIRTVNVEI